MATKHENTILGGNTQNYQNGQAHKNINTVGYARGRFGPITDISMGASMGYSYDVSFFHSAADYTKRPTIPFLLEFPAGLNDLHDPTSWQSAMKAIMELAPRSISGLDQTLSIEYTESPYGGAGEVMETLAKVRRARSVPQFEWVEKIGKPIHAFWEGYILNLLGNPETNVPAVVALGKRTPYGMYPDYTTFTMMFVETDPTQKFVIEAWLITNMSPKEGPTNQGSRDITETPQNLTHSISFTGIQQVGAGVRKFAQQLLDRANQTGIDPNNRPAWIQQIEADVLHAPNGYVEQMLQLGEQGQTVQPDMPKPNIKLDTV